MLQHPSGGQRATWSSLTQLGPRAQKKMSLFTSSMGNPKWVLPIDKVSISHLSSGFKSLYHSPFQTSILNSTCHKEADLMMCPVPNKSLDDRAGPWMRATSWKTTVFDNLLYRTLPEPCSTSPPFPPSERPMSISQTSQLGIHQNLSGHSLWIVGLQLTLIFSFKLVSIFKSSWQGTSSNNQKNLMKREAISIHSFVHEGGKIIIQKAKLKMAFQSVGWKLAGVQRS